MKVGKLARLGRTIEQIVWHDWSDAHQDEQLKRLLLQRLECGGEELWNGALCDAHAAALPPPQEGSTQG